MTLTRPRLGLRATDPLRRHRPAGP